MNKYKKDIEGHIIASSHRDNESYGHLYGELDEVYRKATALDELEEGEFVFKAKDGSLKKARQSDITLIAQKSQAWDEFAEYFDNVVSEEGYVRDTDENIVVNIQNIRMNYQFESE